MKKLSMIFVGLLVVVGLSGCAAPAGDTAAGTYGNIDVRELKELMDAGQEMFLVDVHIPEQQHIRGTDDFIPYNAISSNIDKFPKDKRAKIIVYCRSGNMSQEASQKLTDLGYLDVSNVEGGVYAWKAAGYSL